MKLTMVNSKRLSMNHLTLERMAVLTAQMFLPCNVAGVEGRHSCFMLHAVASMLEKQLHVNGDVDTHIVLISMNSGSACQRGDNACAAILSRIAWELSGCETALSRFQMPTTMFSVSRTTLLALPVF